MEKNLVSCRSLDQEIELPSKDRVAGKELPLRNRWQSAQALLDQFWKMVQNGAYIMLI